MASRWSEGAVRPRSPRRAWFGYPSGGTPLLGYRGGAIQKMFSDVQSGGSESAFNAAVDWRPGQLRAAGVPDAEGRRVVLMPRSPSGIVGVHLRPARRGASAGWTATFELADGSRLQRVWPLEAENRVGSVFILAADTRDTAPPDVPLHDRFVTVARSVAADPEWMPPL